MPPAAVAAAPEAGQPAHLYLDNFLDSVESLPQELQRNFMLMRQLDTRTQELMAKIERSTRDILRRRENLTEQRTEDLTKKVKDDQRECLCFSDEKISLVSQTYELVESHIRRLDSELVKFQDDLKERASEGPGGNKNKKLKTDRKLMFQKNGWVGQKVLRYWDSEVAWFEAVVTDFKPAEGGHKLTYDIGTEAESFEWYDLDEPISTEVDLSAFQISTI